MTKSGNNQKFKYDSLQKPYITDVGGQRTNMIYDGQCPRTPESHHLSDAPGRVHVTIDPGPQADKPFVVDKNVD